MIKLCTKNVNPSDIELNFHYDKKKESTLDSMNAGGLKETAYTCWDSSVSFSFVAAIPFFVVVVVSLFNHLL